MDCFTRDMNRSSRTAYHDAGAEPSAGQRLRYTSSASSVSASEPIDIPQSPFLRGREESDLDLGDFSEELAAANSIWSSACSPTEPSAHMLKWEAMVKRNSADVGEEMARGKPVDDSITSEDGEERSGCLDEALPEDGVFEMEMET